jgi:RNA polymerase sigma-B factor
LNPNQELHKSQDLESSMLAYLKNGSPEARQNVINAGRAMVHYYAEIYSPGNLDPSLLQAANEGFMTALTRFVPSHNVLFSTYATHCIISEIRQELRTRKLFKMPLWLRKLQEDVINATEVLAQENSFLPTLESIASKVNVAEKGIMEAMQAGNVSLSEIDIGSIKSLRNESFKLPIEDVITIRKSMDRLNDIQKKVLSLISVNLRELSLAIEEEEQALTKTQARYMRLVENGSNVRDTEQCLSDLIIGYPQEFIEDEVLRYFEVLSDEFGLRLVDLRYKGRPRDEDANYMSIRMEIDMEGRYRGLLQLLDYLRKEIKAIRVDRVRTARNENIPARMNINISLSAFYNK